MPCPPLVSKRFRLLRAVVAGRPGVPAAVANMPIKVVDIDLSEDPRDLSVPEPYDRVLAVVRWRGRPVGELRLPAHEGLVHGTELRAAAVTSFGERLAATMVDDLLPEASDLAPNGPRLETTTIIVCTRNRVDDLRRCLDALCAFRAEGVDVLVIDNAPSDDRTARLVAEYPVGYAREPRRGLAWARARGAEVARGDLVLYTDDDALADAGWVDAMRRPFCDPQVGAVTGLAMPIELETDAQELFERHVGFSRGFVRREFTALTVSPLAAGTVGAGVSMAFRRRLVTDLGFFATELGTGSIARSGEETYAFYRLLSLGYRIVYSPEALVWHRHRRTMDELLGQLRGYSVGITCVLLRALLQHGESSALRSLWWWFRVHVLGELRRGLARHPDAQPLRLTLAELRGCLEAPWVYVVSRHRERAAGPIPS